MRRLLAVALAVAFCGSASLGTDLDLAVVTDPDGLNEVTVAAGSEVDYKVVAELSDDANMGLALVGFTVSFSGGDLDPVSLPDTEPMNNFVSDETQDLYSGISNPVGPCPPRCGYKGTVIGGDLVQVGGGQNTIKNTDEYAPFPLAAVIEDVGTPGGPWFPVVVATGTVTAPNEEGTYTLTVSDMFANVIQPGQDGNPFWATEAAGEGDIGSLTIHVTGPEVVKWESMATHGDGVGELALEITPPNAEGDCTFSEPRYCGRGKVLITFSGAIDDATAIPDNVSVAGIDCVSGNPIDFTGTTIATSVIADDKQMEITFAPALPDYSSYTVSLVGVTGVGGSTITGTTSIEFIGLLGDANKDMRVLANDYTAVRSLVGVPLDTNNMWHVRSDANCDGRLLANDYTAIRGLVPRDASGCCTSE